MLTADGVIQAARDLHPAFDDRRHPPAVALRALSRYQRTLHGRAAAIRAQAFTVSHTVDLPLADHAAGITLPDPWRAIDRVFCTSRLGREQVVDLVPEVRVNDANTPRLAAFTRGQVLYLARTASAWTDYRSVTVRYVPIPGELTALDDELILPDTAEAALVAHLAFRFAQRGHLDPALPPVPLDVFADEAQRAEAEFLADLGNANTAETWRVRDVR